MQFSITLCSACFLSVIIVKRISKRISVKASPSVQFSHFFPVLQPLIHSLCLPYLRRAISKCAYPTLMLLFESPFAIVLPSLTLFPFFSLGLFLQSAITSSISASFGLQNVYCLFFDLNYRWLFFFLNFRYLICSKRTGL